MTFAAQSPTGFETSSRRLTSLAAILPSHEWLENLVGYLMAHPMYED